MKTPGRPRRPRSGSPLPRRPALPRSHGLPHRGGLPNGAHAPKSRVVNALAFTSPNGVDGEMPHPGPSGATQTLPSRCAFPKIEKKKYFFPVLFLFRKKRALKKKTTPRDIKIPTGAPYRSDLTVGLSPGLGHSQAPGASKPHSRDRNTFLGTARNFVQNRA